MFGPFRADPGRRRAPRRPTAADRFAAARSGAAAVEFALIIPFMAVLLCSGWEVNHFAKAVRQLTNASTTVATMIAQNTTGTVNDTDLLFFRDAIMIAYPDVLVNAFAAGKPWSSDIQVTISSVAFTAASGCTSNCTYQAKVAWSGGANPRPCSVALASASDGATPSPTTLPADTFGPGSLIVVDLKYQYRPSIGGTVLGSPTLARSFYIQPRYVTTIAYSPNGTKFATQCPST